MNKILIVVTKSGQNGFAIMAMKGLHISQSSKTGTSRSDCFMSYPGHVFVRDAYPTAEMYSAYFIAPCDWVQTKSCRSCFAQYSCLIILFMFYF